MKISSIDIEFPSFRHVGFNLFNARGIELEGVAMIHDPQPGDPDDKRISPTASPALELILVVSLPIGSTLPRDLYGPDGRLGVSYRDQVADLEAQLAQAHAAAAWVKAELFTANADHKAERDRVYADLARLRVELGHARSQLLRYNQRQSDLLAQLAQTKAQLERSQADLIQARTWLTEEIVRNVSAPPPPVGANGWRDVVDTLELKRKLDAALEALEAMESRAIDAEAELMAGGRS